MSLQWLIWGERMQNAWAIALILILSFPFQCKSEELLVRVVEQMTGTNPKEESQVCGQDSLLFTVLQDRVVFFFGDTVLDNGTTSAKKNCNAIGAKYPQRPNTMAWTYDKDLSRGVNLTYLGGAVAAPVLWPLKTTQRNEATVWVTNAVTIGNDIYGTYYTVAKGWPAPPATFGSGVAVMKQGQSIFNRTNLFFEPNDPFSNFGSMILSPNLDYVYLFRVDDSDGSHKMFLGRVPVSALTSLDPLVFKSQHQYFTQSGWSQSNSNLVYFFNNTNPPSIGFNKHLNKWVAVSNSIFSEFGLLSEITMRTADDLTGPWSAPIRLYGEKYNPETQPDALFGTVYNPAYLQPFDKDNGRAFYFSATDGAKYNVRLFEGSYGYGNLKFQPNNETGEMLVDEKVRGVFKGAVLPSGNHPATLDKLANSVVGIKLNGWNYIGKKAVKSSKLFIPFRVPASRDASLTLKLQLVKPNLNPTIGTSFEILEKLDSVTLNYFVRRNDLGINVGNTLSPLIEKAYSHPAWKDGNPNFVWLLINREDSENSGAIALRYKDILNSPPSLDVCQGDCPLTDTNGDGAIKVTCIGDSNTGTAVKVTGVTSWCDYFSEKVKAKGWIVTNRGVSGTSATEQGPGMLNTALKLDQPDLVIMAYGTNDVGYYKHDAQTTVNSYKKLVNVAQSGGARSIVATSPPQLCYALVGLTEDPVGPLNSLLKSSFLSEDLLDFYSIMNPSTDFRDCIHMNNSGQQKRAEAAYSKLVP